MKKRAAVVLHFFMRRANANGEHSTMWAWYWFCKNFYLSSPPEQRRWALFYHLCLRQRRYKVTPYWTLSGFIAPWHPKKYSNTVLFGVQVFKTCKYCKEATALDCGDSEEWSAKYGETADDRESMRMAEFGYY